MDGEKKSFAQAVAETLIERLRAGTAPWQRPWAPADPAKRLPYNPTTGNRYRGINAMILMSQDRTDHRWMTYRQAANAGAQIRKGEHGTPIQYWKFTEEQTKTDEAGKPVLDAKGITATEFVRLERPRVFLATVFNGDQIDGLEPPTQKPPIWNRHKRAEQMLTASGADIRHAESDHAFYRPATDSIHLPLPSQFRSADSFYATALHELGHWTGHPARLDRDLSNPFGSEEYAREELRAEIASMLIGEELGIGHDPAQHVAYVKSWIRLLEEDPLEIFRACTDAEKIHDYVLASENRLVQTQAERQQQEVRVETATHADRDSETIAAVLLDPDIQRRIAGDAGANPKKTYIDVPFAEKDEAKALGAQWDREQRSWYVPAALDLAQFARWPHHSPQPGQGAGTPAAEGNGIAPAPPAIAPRKYLAVPFSDRLAAKDAGAKWDATAKSWYAGPDADMAKLDQWTPGRVTEQAPAMDPRAEFAAALKTAGCIVDGQHPVMDGTRQRIAVEGGKQGAKDGFYVAHLDGRPAGRIVNNRTGTDLKWKARGYALSEEQKAAIQADAAQKLQARADARQQEQERAATRVAEEINGLSPATTPTPYMRAKGISPAAGVYTDAKGKETLVPAHDVAGKQWTMQYIQEDGTKRFPRNSRKEGCFHVIGGVGGLDAAPAIVIAEGYATASSLAEALGFPTVAAFDSGNLLPVAKALREKYPAKPFIIAGDDDIGQQMKTGHNPGRRKAMEAAEAVHGRLVLPIFAPGEQLADQKNFTDFNDLATKSALGREAITRQVRPVVTAEIERQPASLTAHEDQKRSRNTTRRHRRVVTA